MHAGDVFPNKGTPFMDTNSGGSGISYADTIGKAAAGIRNVDTVIPGHSTVMKWADFQEYAEFNRAFLDAARAAHKAGKTAEQAAMELKLPDKFKDYGLGRAATNFGVIFGEL